MRISGSEKNDIYSKYKLINEAGSVANTGEGTPSQIQGINNVGNNSPKIPRSPVASMKGEVPETPTVGPASQDEEDSHEDEAISMAKTQLLSVADKAIEMFDMMHNHGVELEAWEAAKLTLAADYIETVFDVMKYRGAQESEPEVEVETENPDDQEPEMFTELPSN